MTDQRREKIAEMIWNAFCVRHGGPYLPGADTFANRMCEGLAAEISIALDPPIPNSPALAEVLEALRPFAEFRVTGFSTSVLEVVNSNPERKERRIEPIWSEHFCRAAQVYAKYGEAK